MGLDPSAQFIRPEVSGTSQDPDTNYDDENGLMRGTWRKERTRSSRGRRTIEKSMPTAGGK
jgi:hypothetical protein